VLTELVHHADGLLVVRAELLLGDGSRVSAHAGAETIEQAEDAAIVRAVALLAAPPVPSTLAGDAVSSQPAEGEVAADEPPARGEPSAAAPAEATDDADEVLLEDYSWTAFWRWARKRGVKDRPAIESVIGRSLGDMTPAEVRAALASHLPD
jgi:hypothetical protein